MMTLFGRKLNHPVILGTTVLAISVNSIGLAQGWWTGIVANVIIMLAVAFGAGWLFGSPSRDEHR